MPKPDGANPPDASPKLATPERVAAFKTGLSAETRAAAYLMAKGYRILARRFKTPYGEIDIVAKKRDLIAFIEGLDIGADAKARLVALTPATYTGVASRLVDYLG